MLYITYKLMRMYIYIYIAVVQLRGSAKARAVGAQHFTARKTE